MLHVTHKWAKVPAGALAIDTTSKSGQWSEFSPFLLPGGPLYGDFESANMENAWQFAKLYAEHADAAGRPTPAYWDWATAGWADTKAHRYPKGKGARPLHSWWNGVPLDYITARKRIYAPLYARAVKATSAYLALQALLRDSTQDIYLRDWDGYDHLARGLTIEQVANNPAKKMGHAFVLWALVEGQYDRLIDETLPIAPAQAVLQI